MQKWEILSVIFSSDNIEILFFQVFLLELSAIMWNFQDSSQKHVYTDILHNLVNSCWKVVISLSANPMYLKVVLHVR